MTVFFLEEIPGYLIKLTRDQIRSATDIIQFALPLVILIESQSIDQELHHCTETYRPSLSEPWVELEQAKKRTFR